MNRDLIIEILDKYFEAIALEEAWFVNQKNLDYHYKKHVESDEDGKLKMDCISKDEYNWLANELSSSPCGDLTDKSSDVIGYTTKSGKFVKWDKQTGLMVVYVPSEAIALYKTSPNKFWNKVNNHWEFGYKSNLPMSEKKGR